MRLFIIAVVLVGIDAMAAAAVAVKLKEQSGVVKIGAVVKRAAAEVSSQPNAQFTEIKQEQFLIYNDEKHPLKSGEFEKDTLAQKALNLAIVRYNEMNTGKMKFLKFDKLLNGSTVQPIEIKIYLFKTQLIETDCENKLEFRKNLMRQRQVRNTLIDECKATNRIHQCLFDVRVSPWEKFDANKYKFNRLYCK